MTSSRDRWKEEASRFLSHPPRSNRGVLSRAPLPVSRNNEIQALRFLFAGFVDLYCDSLPELRRRNVKEELHSFLVQFGFVPAVVFSDEWSALRISCSDLVSRLVRSLFQPTADLPARDEKVLSLPSLLTPSRYRSEFEELKLIGEGGFGVVYKVRSVLDRHEYAVKRIPIRSSSEQFSQRVLHEVHVLATLSHNNIIRYHCGWVEVEANDSYGSPSPVPPRSPNGLQIKEIFDGDGGSGDDPHKDNLIEMVSEPASMMSDASEVAVQHKTGGKFWIGASSSEDSMSVHIQQPPPNKAIEGVPEMSIRMVIYIQMELCETTLDEFLVTRNRALSAAGIRVVDGEQCASIFKQLLDAVDYIHRKGIIHRDIKPGNVFLRHSSNVGLRVKLGDFGLSCIEELPTTRDSGSASPLRRVHSVGVGTMAYASPEQLKSSTYGPSVDIYSLGILLCELYMIFDTGSERVQSITALRKEGKAPQILRDNWPSVANMIDRMVNVRADERPTAEQIVKEINTESAEVRSLREIIENQKKEIMMLRKKLKHARLHHHK